MVNVCQKQLKEAIEKSLLTLTKSFIDSTRKLLKFMAEENAKSRKHEMEMLKLTFNIYLKLLYFC